MLIGIVGFKSSGKDTAANYLIEQGYHALAFADSIKDCLSSIFCWDRDLLNGDTPESRAWREQVDPWWARNLGIPEFTPRYAMTNFGTDIMRAHFNPRVWLLNTGRRMQQIYDTQAEAGIVVKDGRFPNELDFIRDQGGIIIRVKRGPEPEWIDIALRANEGDHIARMHMDWLGVHESEWAWIGQPIDATFENDSTIAALHTKIAKVFFP